MEHLIQEIEVLSPEAAKTYLEIIKSAPEEIWKPAQVMDNDGSDQISDVRRCDIVNVTDLVQHTNDQFSAYLIEHAATDICRIYKETLKLEYPAYHHHWIPEVGSNTFQLLRYGEDNFYDWHMDDILAPKEYWGNQLDGSRMSKRKISIVLYLNDDFEGGATAFPWGEVKPAAGSAVVFPSSFPFLHTGMPVISGVKYALVTWAYEGIIIAVN